MNWAGTSLLSFLVALVGALVGGVTHYELRRRGIDFPPVVGLIGGFAAAIACVERSSMRGIIVATIVVWVAAVAEVKAAPVNGFVQDMIHFSDRLDATRFALYVCCVVAGLVIGSRAFRRDRDSAPQQSGTST